MFTWHVLLAYTHELSFPSHTLTHSLTYSINVVYQKFLAIHLLRRGTSAPHRSLYIIYEPTVRCSNGANLSLLIGIRVYFLFSFPLPIPLSLSLSLVLTLYIFISMWHYVIVGQMNSHLFMA